MPTKAGNALYDPQYGFNPPARFQQERAWCEVIQKEKHIQGMHEKQARELERRGAQHGRKWPGGPACGSAPFFVDGDIWRNELLKRQPLKSDPSLASTSGVGNNREELTRMQTTDILELKRRTEEELEKRSWAKALANLNTVELGDLSSAIGQKLERRQGRSGYSTQRQRVHRPHTPPIRPSGKASEQPRGAQTGYSSKNTGS